MWVLFGGHGWIGKQFTKILRKNRIDYLVPSIRMDDIKAVDSLLKEMKPDRVISFIGRTWGPGCSTIDYLEIIVVISTFFIKSGFSKFKKWLICY